MAADDGVFDDGVFDVVVVGAGLSGIGAAYRLQTMRPGTSFAVVEARASIGGTWDLFRYPGVRSDSDMHTLGYPFRPWQGDRSIAGGPEIRRYIEDTATAYGISGRIRFGERVVSASWSSSDPRWELEVDRGGSRRRYRCRFLYLCSGYFDYRGGYQPRFPGVERFQGRLVHPQGWPEDLDYANRRVVVIGSGATAVTLVPAMAQRAAHVTMLQRSPSWMAALPAVDPAAAWLRGRLPAGAASATRWKNVVASQAFYQLCRRRPERAKRLLHAGAARHLPEGYPLDPDFTPAYQPWDQRLCLVPDGDLFKAVADGRASVVTDTLDMFTAGGVRLSSGRQLDADVVVSATGLRLLAWGGIALSVDGRAVAPPDTVLYRGCMLSGVPNLAICLGYTNASWTLRSDLTSRWVCRLLGYMDRRGYAQAVPDYEGPRPDGPLLELTSGYVRRAADRLPRQGSRQPWRLRQNYLRDRLTTSLAGLGTEMAFYGPPAS